MRERFMQEGGPSGSAGGMPQGGESGPHASK